MGIFALRDIPVGEELSYDYQFQHYGLAQAAGDYRSGPFCMHAHDTCISDTLQISKLKACCHMSEQLTPAAIGSVVTVAFQRFAMLLSQFALRLHLHCQ